MRRTLSAYSLPLNTLLLALLLVAAGTPAQGQSNTNIAGTWNVVWASTDGGPQFVAMIQFSSDGNLITTETDAFAVSMGVWQRVDWHTYALTVYSYAFPAFGQPYQGTFKSRARLRLTPNSEVLSGNYHLDFYDTNGVLQFSDDGTITGSRVHVQLMP